MSSSGRSKSFFLGLLALLVSFAALELGARLLESFSRDFKRAPDVDDRVWSVFTPDRGWALRPGYRGVVGGYARVFDADGFLAVDSRQVKDPAAKRVLFIGDSNMFGVGTPTNSSFVEMVDSLVPGVAAINLAVPGYTSFQGRRVLDKYMPTLKPVAVVASFNFNDKKYALPQIGRDSNESLLDLYRSSNGGMRDLRKNLEYSHLVVVLRKMLQSARLLPRPPAAFRVDTMQIRVDPERYRENLRYMAESAKKSGARMIFLILRDNPLYTRPITAGIALLDSGRTDEAIANFRFAVHEDNGFSDLGRIYLARAYRAIGQDAAAESALVSTSVQTSIFGGRPLHLDSEYNDIMRQVAAETGSELVDASPVLLSHPGDFTDYCHLDAAAHHRVGHLLADKIAGLLQPAP
jgi:lysophospholipase L1-like esterase